MPPPPPVRHWRGSVGVGGWETRHSSDEPAAGSSMRPERLRHHPGGGVGSGEDTGGRTSVRAPAPGERLQLRSDCRRRKQGGRGRGCGGGGGTPPCRPTPEAHSRRRGRGPAAAEPAGVGAGRNQCESVPIQRLENGCNESGSQAAGGRAAVRARERSGNTASRRTRSVGPTDARWGRRTRAAGPTEARGGADRRTRQGRLRRAAGPTDARGGADERGPADGRGAGRMGQHEPDALERLAVQPCRQQQVASEPRPKSRLNQQPESPLRQL